MAGLTVDDNEKLSRKEYLKQKRKKKLASKKISKKKILLLSIIVLLALYVFVQFYIYYRENNYNYVSTDDVDKQRIYGIYYLSEGYTYNPLTSLNYIDSDSFGLKLLYEGLGFTNIILNDNYIYGICEKSLRKFNLQTKEIQILMQDSVIKFNNYEDELYVIADTKKLYVLNGETGESKDTGIENVYEVVVDSNYIYVCIDEISSKKLYRVSKEDYSKTCVSDSANVSYVVQGEDKLFFVNKADENKIYSVNKDGTDYKKVGDFKSITDTGDISLVDGSNYMFEKGEYLYFINLGESYTLWRVNLNTSESEKVLGMSIDMMKTTENVIIYKVKNERGIYLYNLDTAFTSRISTRLIKEFVIVPNDSKNEEIK